MAAHTHNKDESPLSTQNAKDAGSECRRYCSAFEGIALGFAIAGFVLFYVGQLSGMLLAIATVLLVCPFLGGVFSGEIALDGSSSRTNETEERGSARLRRES